MQGLKVLGQLSPLGNGSIVSLFGIWFYWYVVEAAS